MHVAKRFEWDNTAKLDNLLMFLRDKALKFYSTRPLSVQKNCDQLMEKMTQRFGNKELPHTIRRQLQDAKQNMEESIEEFAERTEMATDGYADGNEDIMEMIATDTVLKGCQDKQAALHAMDKNPKSVNEALRMVKSATHNRKVLLGQRKPEVKKVHIQEEDSSARNLQ